MLVLGVKYALKSLLLTLKVIKVKFKSNFNSPLIAAT